MKHNIVKIVLTMGFIILILLYNISWNISREVNGVMIKLDDSSFLEPITVKLEGTYDVNCLCKDVYKGYIRISNNDLTDYIVDDQLEINVENGSPITYMYDKSDWQFKENGEAFIIMAIFYQNVVCSNYHLKWHRTEAGCRTLVTALSQVSNPMIKPCAF